MIAGFSGGGFKIDDNVYRALLITPQPCRWLGAACARGHSTLDDLAPLLGARSAVPEFLLLGTGPALIRPAPKLHRARSSGKAVSAIEAMDSRAAARAWAVLRGEGRWIAGALYPL